MKRVPGPAMKLEGGIRDDAIIHQSLPASSLENAQGRALDYAQLAEVELAQAETSTGEATRKRHYFRAAILLNLAFGGDPRPGGEKGLTY